MWKEGREYLGLHRIPYRGNCLAHIDVQNGKYNEAINRLQGVFADKSFTDNELYARTLFQIGKINLNFLNDRASAKVYFNRVAAEYPQSKAAGHQYVKDSSK